MDSLNYDFTRAMTKRKIESLPVEALLNGLISRQQALLLRPVAQLAASRWFKGELSYAQAYKMAFGGGTQ